MPHSAALALLDALPTPVVLVDQSEHVIAMNPGAIDLLGQDQIGRHVVTVIRQPAVLEAITRAMVDGRVSESRYTTRDHVHETLYKVTCTPLEPEPEEAALTQAGALVSFQDVTSQETAGQMRRDFVANVSHELRTPLTSIQGFVETLQGPARGDEKAAERFLGTMANECERMIRLVNDLLSLSQVESEERVRPTERVDLDMVLDTVVEYLAPQADSADVTLHVSHLTDPIWVLGDGDQLMQVFTNLAENGIKYGGEGGRVEITLGKIARDPILGQGAIQIDVRDFGAGFDEMHTHRLTERFYRIDSHRSRAKGGTGLGLAIVKHIVNRHKGRLRISSELGKGSCFSVLLPES